LDSNTACTKGGEHKLIEDIPGEKSCTKCGITIIMKEGVGYTDPFSGKPKDSSQGPVISKGSLGSKNDKSVRKYLRHHAFNPFSEPEIKRALTQVDNATWNEGQKTRALELFQTTRKKLKGKNFETFVDACCYIACREQGVPMHSFSQQKRKKTKLVKYYREICNYLKIGLPPFKAINSLKWVGERVEYVIDDDLELRDVKDLEDMQTYGDYTDQSVLKLPPGVIKKATKILSKIPDSETGSNPLGIAASILYIVSVTTGHPFTQRQFAEAAEVNLQTVSRNTKRLNDIIKKNKLGKHIDHNTRYHRIV